MFTIKQLEAKSTSPSGIAPGSEFGGTFTVPSYRSGLFLDPKVNARIHAKTLGLRRENNPLARSRRCFKRSS
jgi:hypothetical protein